MIDIHEAAGYVFILLKTDVKSIRARLLVLNSLVMIRQVMEVVVIKIPKKLSNDAHWMCSDICILTGSTAPPGVAFSAGCV